MSTADDRSSGRISDFDEDYRTNTAPWVIGTPQPAVVALERDGWIRGTVLDTGCGTGEHTIMLAQLGYDVRGIDSSATAVAQARANAAARTVPARFDVADALVLSDDHKYDTVIDSALFHVHGLDRAAYVRSLRRATRPGARVHILALADIGPEHGPQIEQQAIRDAFDRGWIVEDLRLSTYRCLIGDTRSPADLPAWLARIRRT